MNSSDAVLIDNFFSRNTLREVIDEGGSAAFDDAVKRYVPEAENLTHEECFSSVYRYIRKEYRNEYYYKNTLLNTLLLGVHSTKTTTALTELPVGRSKADFILINGKTVVYEIKTALDNFNRLEGQIEDYYKAFSRVAVVTAEEQYEELKKKLQHPEVGIYVLTERGTLHKDREPEEYTDKLSKTTMFKILRKLEYEHIVLNHYGVLPDVSQFYYYRTCLSLFEAIPTDEAYRMFVRTLKRRTSVDTEEYSHIPYELKFLVYFSNYRKSDYEKLQHFLSA